MRYFNYFWCAQKHVPSIACLDARIDCARGSAMQEKREEMYKLGDIGQGKVRWENKEEREERTHWEWEGEGYRSWSLVTSVSSSCKTTPWPVYFWIMRRKLRNANHFLFNKPLKYPITSICNEYPWTGHTVLLYCCLAVTSKKLEVPLNRSPESESRPNALNSVMRAHTHKTNWGVSLKNGSIEIQLQYSAQSVIMGQQQCLQSLQLSGTWIAEKK